MIRCAVDGNGKVWDFRAWQLPGAPKRLTAVRYALSYLEKDNVRPRG